MKKIALVLFGMFSIGAAHLYAEPFSFVDHDLTAIGRIWDVTGVATGSVDDVDFEFTMSQDNRGKIEGFGSWTVEMFDVTATGDFYVKGKILQSADGDTMLQLKFNNPQATDGGDLPLVRGPSTGRSASMQDVVAADEGDQQLIKDFKIKDTVLTLLAVEGTNSVMHGVFDMEITVGGQRRSFSQYMVFRGADDFSMDGSSVLSLDTATQGSQLKGVAALTLSNEEQIVFVQKGSVKKGEAKISLSGSKQTGDSGAKLKLVTDDTLGQILSLKGKVMGQKIFKPYGPPLIPPNPNL